MTYYKMFVLVGAEAGMVLLLVLALVAIAGVVRRPPIVAIVAGVTAIAIGVLLLLHAHLGWGLFGPVDQLRYIPKRIAFLGSQGPGQVDYWELTNPMYYSGILGFGLLIGGSALLWSRLLWSRWVILLCCGALTGLYIVRVGAPAWSRDTYPMDSGDLATFGLTAGIASLLLISLCLPGTKKRLSGEPRSPSSPMARA
jgi:hypothetical protein